MSRHIVLSPDALADVQAIELWYYLKEVSLSYRFAAKLQFTLRLIAQYPYAFPLVDSDVRRALMNGFPYSVFFTLKSGAVFVIAVVHQRRQSL